MPDDNTGTATFKPTGVDAELSRVLEHVGGHGDAGGSEAGEAAASLQLPAAPAPAPPRAKRKYERRPGSNPPGGDHRKRAAGAAPPPQLAALEHGRPTEKLRGSRVGEDRRTKDEIAASEAHLKSQLDALRGASPNAEQEERAVKVLKATLLTVEGVCYVSGHPEMSPTIEEADFFIDSAKRPLAPYLGQLGPGVDLIPVAVALGAMVWGGLKRERVAQQAKKERAGRNPIPPTKTEPIPGAIVPAKDQGDQAREEPMVGPVFQ